MTTYALGGFGSRSTLFRVRMSPLGSWQCCSGFSPGTESEPSTFGATAGELPKREERAATELARKAVATVKRCMVGVSEGEGGLVEQSQQQQV